VQNTTAIFIFRRDLRLNDNLALISASKAAAILPVFIFDPRQLAPHPYRSESGMQFLFNSLQELETEIRANAGNLHFFHGIAEEVLPLLIKNSKATAVYSSRDYTPFAITRDQKNKQICESLGAEYHSIANLLINEPEAIKTQQGKNYSIFTPFYKSSSKIEVAKPIQAVHYKFANLESDTALPFFSIDEARKRYLPAENPNLILKGGRLEALKLLERVAEFKNYKEDRNLPALKATSLLSAHNKFGTISIREFYHKVADLFGQGHTLVTELYWRDFLTHIGFNFPHVFKGAFNKPLDRVAWEDNDEYLLAWQEGRTGFPIVDAGMRELNSTGIMHNRVRMIVASFLTKDLLLDWHHGERYFARKLLDFDPAVNNGNWQWAASTGCDAQPYFRIFNPWLQSEKFDPQALYIKRWVPELTALTPKQIHNLYKLEGLAKEYPKAIVDHSEQKTKAIRLFEEAKGK
jgi:deoxyribodipyrimidine photo-lyase